ncbi:MAG: ADP-ribosylglycohydrolase family protein [Bacilli bacterium]|nr:ADP-ribosylglycohydrolase family protein [Bacilli bacterium]
MYGNIIGDLAGSIYEYGQIKKVSHITIDKLISEDSFISDDTILTIAIIDAIVNNKEYGEKLREYGIKYEDFIKLDIPYFEKTFSPGFLKWAHGNFEGQSCGNGAMMRIAPIGYLFNSLEEVEEQTKLATIPSHNSKEAIECATIIAKIIFFARKGYSKEEIIENLNITLYEKEIKQFNYTCSDTIGVCLYSLFTTDSYDDAIKKVLSYGGDTDTNACIVGGMAEAIYGLDEQYIEKANEKLPEEFKKVLKKAYTRLK